MRESASNGTVGWAAYLGCSWTWCIGMFLPILLLRDYGWWSFAAFVIPNVIGAGALGWTLTRERAAALIAAHRPALIAFSVVTIAFHGWLGGWVTSGWNAGLPESFGAASAGYGAAGLLLGAGLFAAPFAARVWGHRLGRGFGIPALVVWAVSVVCLVLYAGLRAGTAGGLGLGSVSAIEGPGLLGLIPVCVLGFVCCPYLDATFLHARASTDRGPMVFGLGFGVFFFAMIIGTCVYAGQVLGSLAAAGVFVLVHIAVQSFFTVAVHADRMVTLAPVRWRVAGPAAAVLLFAVSSVVVRMAPASVPGLSMSASEVGYRVFMAFYGLVFPAYVWACVAPTFRAPTAPSRAQVLGASLAIGIAAPFYAIGFIGLRSLWLIPGVLIVLASRPLARFFEPGHDRPSRLADQG